MGTFIIWFLILVSFAVRTSSICPLLGPDYPSPRNFTQNPEFRKAVDSFSNTIHQWLTTDPETPFNPTNGTFSINVFSRFSDAPLYEYHYTAPLFSDGSIGTKKVDGDTVYRIGSISKLLTVFALLVESGDAHLNDPITKYIPELRNFTRTAHSPVDAVQWNDVTLGALASHMSGLGRDFGVPDLSQLGPAAIEAGLPPLNASDLPTCGIGMALVPMCSRQAFFEGFVHRHPVFAPFTTPVYSNVAFQILAYALEHIANNKKYASVLLNKVLKPLRMDNTSVSLPKNSSVGAIPGRMVAHGWDVDFGDLTPAGGIYSTTNDLAKLGRAILNSSLLSPAQTRRWMKPVTHTSSLTASIGGPWEIFRANTARGVVDLYTKAGDVGVYSTLLVLIPDFDTGWVLLSAAESLRSALTGARMLADQMADIFIPAFEAVAKDQAKATFTGTYMASANSGLNSSIVIVTDDLPGLGVQSFVSNGTDIFESYLSLYGFTDAPVNSTIRLYPTNLLQASPRQQAFRSVFELLLPPTPTNRTTSSRVFSSNCESWGDVDSMQYGHVAVDDFVFHFDENGNAVSLEPRVVRVNLDKVKALKI